MTKARSYRLFILTVLVCAETLACQSIADKTRAESYTGSSKEELLLSIPQDLGKLAALGPYNTQVFRNIPITLSPNDQIVADFFETQSQQIKPILIISHGNKSSKNSHFEQAKQIASWGINVLTVSFPNTGQWLKNGNRLLKVSQIVSKTPWIFSSHINPEKIIIAGHSFGGSATAIAMGSEAPALGAILLDPALYSKSVIGKLRQITKPMILIGADPRVFKSRERATFYNETRGPMYEISIKDAYHDDAQNPSIRQVTNIFSYDPLVSQDRQKLFAAAITLSVLSLANNGELQAAWNTLARSAKTSLNLIANRFKAQPTTTKLSLLNQNSIHPNNRTWDRNIQ